MCRDLLYPGTFLLYKHMKKLYNDYAKQKTITILGKLSIFIIEGSLSIPFLIAVELCKSANSGSYRGVSPFRCFLFGEHRGLRFSVR